MKKDKKKFLVENFKALADENRLKILCYIYDKKMVCVSDIAEKLEQSVAIVSHHLHALAKTGIVAPQRYGKRICYQLLDNGFAKDLRKLICKYK